MSTDCESCPLPERLRAAQAIVVELQHLVRELRHEIANHEAAAAGWPRHPETGEEMRL